MAEPKRMIFHAPYPLNPNAISASGIRPYKMAQAFRDLGYEVWLVSGYSKERAEQAREVKRALADGVRFDLCYSESSTMPMTMTDPNHLPLHPWLDKSLFKGLRKVGVPIGHFLRDIFWAFADYRRRVRPPKREVALAGYAWDLATLRDSVDVLYLPSVEMADHIKVGRLKVLPLPPAHDVTTPMAQPASGAHLLYVGAIGGHYKLSKLFAAVEKAASAGNDCSLTVCTSPEVWAGQRVTYEPLMGEAVRVVHASGAELAPLYAKANIGGLFVEPVDYWSFAMPVKMFEYIGQHRPVLAAEGTLAAQFVAGNQAGWVLPYDVDVCAELISALAGDPGRIARRGAGLAELAGQHTWRARAEQVVSDLAG